MKKVAIEANHILSDAQDGKIVVFAWQNGGGETALAGEPSVRVKITLDLEDARNLLADLQENIDYIDTVA